MVFALSNIAANGEEMGEIFLRSDLYASLLKLYHLVGSEVQYEIAHTLKVLISVSEDGEVAILVESGVVEILGEIIRNDSKA